MVMYTIFVTLIIVSTIFSNIANASYCLNIEEKYRPRDRYVSCNGLKKDVVLYWGSDTSRAASGLFAAFLRYRLGYQNVRLQKGPQNLQDLAAHVKYNSSGIYDDVILALATSWKPAPPPKWIPNDGRNPGLAGPRLIELGASQIPVVQHLHLHLPAKFRYMKQCTNANNWMFYNDITALTQCGFINKYSDIHMENKIVVYTLESKNEETISKLDKLAHSFSRHFGFHLINRTNLFQLMRTSNESFLFLDYEIWLDYPDISIVQFPCIPNDDTYICQQELDTVISMRVADVSTLEEYSPQLLQVAQYFTPSPVSIRVILELENSDNSNSIEDAACEYAWKNNTELKVWDENYNSSTAIYEIFLFYTGNEQYNEKILSVLTAAVHELDSQFKMFNAIFRIRRFTKEKSAYVIKNKIERFMERSVAQRFLGAVVDVENMKEIAKNIDGSNLPIIMYGAPEVEANLTKSIWLSTGRSQHLILALQKFMLIMNWGRIAVLSEQTPMAKTFTHDLAIYLKNTRENETFAFRDHVVKTQFVQSDAKKLLQELKSIENARIILVNTNSDAALTILKAAKSLNMNEREGYVWILREWQPNNLTNDIRHVTLSFWCQRNDNVRDIEGNKDIRDEIDNAFFEYKRWPTKVTTMIDAILTLGHGFKQVFLKYSETQYDVHSEFTLRQLKESIHSMSIRGTCHNLTYKDRSLEETVVYLEEWHGEQSVLLARWRVNTTAFEIYSDYELPNQYIKYVKINDGATRCSVTSGDKYLPTCHELEIAIAVLLMVMSPPVLLVIYRGLKRQQEKRVKKIMCDIIRRRQQCAAIVSDHIVERSALTMGQELGTGRFGRVRAAQLNTRTAESRRLQTVAVKYLHDDHNAIEIIREACTLASLDHNHIIRLIGVCIDDNPALLIMEYAFFGDLLQYLQNRWYLAEGASLGYSRVEESATDIDSINEEAVHVSPRALTRLARQAASALAYLCQQGIVHRDIRASNCLVDERRSLKLSDFGLARKVKATDDDDDVNYKSFRCGVFPVVWMAPECINHGIFSTASDVWALGLLIFELVTLGARPYGEMSPKAVYDYVAGGGQPSMPYDATPQTIALARLCWKRKPEERPSAAEIVAYLAEQPCALRPAFKCPYKGPDSPDSGLEDSPTDMLLII